MAKKTNISHWVREPLISKLLNNVDNGIIELNNYQNILRSRELLLSEK